MSSIQELVSSIDLNASIDSAMRGVSYESLLRRRIMRLAHRLDCEQREDLLATASRMTPVTFI